MKNPHYYDQVYDIVQLIPVGRVTTYGAIADYLTLGSARMVGWALYQSMGQAAIPAHRVVNRRGELSGRHHFPNPDYMQEQLEAEGLTIVDHRIVDFDQHFWSPTALLL